MVVDVGADHGRVARTLGAIATERLPERIALPEGRWVVADGLRPFRRVDLAVVAGMGADTIGRILADRPARAVLHAQDDPPKLRRWLAANGWRIVAESLAPEARRYAELVAVEPGEEPATGLLLEYGPALARDGHPHLAAHLAQVAGWLDGLAREGAPADLVAGWGARRAWLEAWMKSL